MHLCCLGVMRRFILCWLRGPLNTRIQSYKVQKLSDHLMSLACNMPREFARRPRSTAEIEMEGDRTKNVFILHWPCGIAQYSVGNVI